MEKKDFGRLENLCQSRFMETGSCFHVCSQENHPVLFHNKEEFKAAMDIVAFAAFLFPDIHIFTFEIMDNHFHFALSGKEERVRSFIKTLVSKLESNPALAAAKIDIRNLSFKLFPIDNLNSLRNVIAYINRNGAVVDPYENVFTYKWGANRFFFNREARLRFESCRTSLTSRQKRNLFHSDLLAKGGNVHVLDGYVSPLCYCHISDAEALFRTSRHYFYCVSRNVEASMEIAKSIGESIYYTDDDLFAHISSVCSKKYNGHSVSTLSKEAKIELAKELHFDFNARNKQISRLLKMELRVISALFPE
ncbi:MAG: hypothetical protein MJY45_05525 [Bacteroidales bacterium]|nr:hypothetical protein [Bacteroidales bacterium]